MLYTIVIVVVIIALVVFYREATMTYGNIVRRQETPGATLNPKVEGSIPSRPLTEALSLKEFWAISPGGRRPIAEPSAYFVLPERLSVRTIES